MSNNFKKKQFFVPATLLMLIRSKNRLRLWQIQDVIIDITRIFLRRERRKKREKKHNKLQVISYVRFESDTSSSPINGEQAYSYCTNRREREREREEDSTNQIEPVPDTRADFIFKNMHAQLYSPWYTLVCQIRLWVVDNAYHLATTDRYFSFSFTSPLKICFLFFFFFCIYIERIETRTSVLYQTLALEYGSSVVKKGGNTVSGFTRAVNSIFHFFFFYVLRLHGCV